MLFAGDLSEQIRQKFLSASVICVPIDGHVARPASRIFGTAGERVDPDADCSRVITASRRIRQILQISDHCFKVMQRDVGVMSQ